MFLYPTLNEGFGMPPLEAMRYGKTCVISGICSLPELYAGAAYFINPYKIEEIKARLITAINEPIAEEIVQQRFYEVCEKQEADIDNACKFIIGE